MSKKGIMRSINIMKVEGSMKMVILMGASGLEGFISIPRMKARSILIPVMTNDIADYRHICSGEYAILVRQP